jgi:hypothetical protein
VHEGTSTVKFVETVLPANKAFQIKQLHSNNRNPKAAISQKPLHQGTSKRHSSYTAKIQNISTSRQSQDTTALQKH